MPVAAVHRKIGKSEIGAWLRAQGSSAAGHMRSASERSAASINLAGLLFVALTAAIWQPDLRLVSRAAEEARPLAAPPAAVTIIGATPRGKECSEQTWPYIERRCLSYAAPGANTEMKFAAPAASGNAPAQGPDARVAAPPVNDAPVAQPSPQTQKPSAADRRAEPSTDDVSVMDDADEYQPLTEEEVRAIARAEARERRRMMRQDFFRHGHFQIGPFRF